MAIRVTNHPIVGTVRWSPNVDLTIKILDGWADKNIVTVDVPQLKGVPTFGGKFGGKVPFFKGAAQQLQDAWAEVERQGLMSRVLFWGGSFVPRMIRGSKTSPSEHTFGCAFDINIAQNGLGVTPPPVGAKGSVRELVPIFQLHGFFWGGDFPKRKDGMHFQIKQLGKVKQIDSPEAIDIFVDGFQHVIPALLIEDRTWIGARALATKLDGEILKAGGNPFVVSMKLNGAKKDFSAKKVGDVGYVPFAEVIKLYGHPFKFDGDKRRIDITTKKP